jgi:hypothetical protein
MGHTGGILLDFEKVLEFAAKGLDKTGKRYTISTMIQLYNETMIQFSL